jgi:adenosine deaminase CECR1
MTLHGWRQLIQWSIDHSCMDDNERASVQQAWSNKWKEFCDWVVKEYEEKPANPTQG